MRIRDKMVSQKKKDDDTDLEKLEQEIDSFIRRISEYLPTKQETDEDKAS